MTRSTTLLAILACLLMHSSPAFAAAECSFYLVEHSGENDFSYKFTSSADIELKSNPQLSPDFLLEFNFNDMNYTSNSLDNAFSKIVFPLGTGTNFEFKSLNNALNNGGLLNNFSYSTRNDSSFTVVVASSIDSNELINPTSDYSLVSNILLSKKSKASPRADILNFYITSSVKGPSGLVTSVSGVLDIFTADAYQRNIESNKNNVSQAVFNSLINNAFSSEENKNAENKREKLKRASNNGPLRITCVLDNVPFADNR